MTQDGLFDNPPPPVLCAHPLCGLPIEWDARDRRWRHVSSRMSECAPQGCSRFAEPRQDTLCPGCGKPMPREWCWDGIPSCPLGKPPRYPVWTADEVVARMNAELIEGPSPAVQARANARRTDPVTSHEAAASLGSDTLRRSQLAVISMFQRFGPMHDQQLVERYEANSEGLAKQSPSGIRTRRSELVQQGVLEDSGQKAVLASGRKAIVWRMWRPGVS